MAIVDYPEEATNGLSTQHRVGGYYSTLEEIERASELLDFDVVVPPRTEFGWYCVPATADPDAVWPRS